MKLMLMITIILFSGLAFTEETWWGAAESDEMNCKIQAVPMRDILAAADKEGMKYKFEEGTGKYGYYAVTLTTYEGEKIVKLGHGVFAKSLDKCQAGANWKKVDLATQYALILDMKKTYVSAHNMTPQESSAWFDFATKRYNEMWHEHISVDDLLSKIKKYGPKK